MYMYIYKYIYVAKRERERRGEGACSMYDFMQTWAGVRRITTSHVETLSASTPSAPATTSDGCQHRLHHQLLGANKK